MFVKYFDNGPLAQYVRGLLYRQYGNLGTMLIAAIPP